MSLECRYAPAEIRPLAGRMMPGVVGEATGLKHPRGPLTPKRMANGMYLLLFYNNMGRSGETHAQPQPEPELSLLTPQTQQ